MFNVLIMDCWKKDTDLEWIKAKIGLVRQLGFLCEITVLCQPGISRELKASIADIKVLEYSEKGFSDLKLYFACCKGLQRRDFQLAIHRFSDFKGSFFAWMSGAWIRFGGCGFSGSLMDTPLCFVEKQWQKLHPDSCISAT